MNTWVFDRQSRQRIHESRKEFLGRLLHDFRAAHDLTSALDVGCGIGFFSNFLSSHGLKVVGLDAREENIAEAGSRYPGVEFIHGDAEDSSIQKLGQFDLVVCFGLLYHLENPFRVVRNLCALTKQILIIESMVSPGLEPIARLVHETPGKDQGLHYVALIPSEACLVRMLFHAGFTEVYATTALPNDEDFLETVTRHRRRTMLVVSKQRLHSALLRPLTQPRPDREDIWQKRTVIALQPAGRCVDELWRFVHGGCTKVIAWLSVLPGRVERKMKAKWMEWKRKLPFRYEDLWWISAPGDEILDALYTGKPFEAREIMFIKSFLKPGQSFWDLGANFGLYTLIAARKVGRRGSVVAVEPDPKNRFRLRLNVLMNLQRRVTVVSAALGDRLARVDFMACSQGAYSGLKVTNVPGTLTRTEVRQTTLTALAEGWEWPTVDMLKMDVEGAELLVVNGGEQLFRDRPRPVVMCEFSDRRTTAYGYAAREIYDWFAARGYLWFSITAGGQLKAQLQKGVYDYDNLVACPVEQLDRLSEWMEL
jgi:tRNA (mo5U34)-methyltransferase